MVEAVPLLDGLDLRHALEVVEGALSGQQLADEELEVLLGEGASHHGVDLLLRGDGDQARVAGAVRLEVVLEVELGTALAPEEGQGLALVLGRDLAGRRGRGVRTAIRRERRRIYCWEGGLEIVRTFATERR